MIHEVYEEEHVEVESDKEEHGEEGQDMEEAVVIESKPSEPPAAQAEELSAEEEPLTLTHPVHEEGQLEVESDKEEHGEEGQDVEEAVAIESKPSEPPAAQTEEARDPGRTDNGGRAEQVTMPDVGEEPVKKPATEKDMAKKSAATKRGGATPAKKAASKTASSISKATPSKKSASTKKAAPAKTAQKAAAESAASPKSAAKKAPAKKVAQKKAAPQKAATKKAAKKRI